MYNIWYWVLVQTMGISPVCIKFFLPYGWLTGSNVTSTFTLLLRRGLGFQPYHSLAGAVYLPGMPMVTGCVVSSTISLAGIGGQLLLRNTAPPIKFTNQGQC